VLAQRNPLAEQIADAVLEGDILAGVVTLEAGLDDVIREAAEVSGAPVAELSGVRDRSLFVGGQDCLHAWVSSATSASSCASREAPVTPRALSRHLE
jgi:hypothetical protein